MSLRSVSEHTSLSTGLLSQIERGQSSASVNTLQLLAEALQVEVETFFSGGSLTAKSKTNPVTRAYERRSIGTDSNGAAIDWLTPRTAGAGLDLYLMYLEPDSGVDGTPTAKQGVETGLLLEGGVELELGDEVYLLGTGDTFTFRSHRSYHIRNAGNRRATIAWARSLTDTPPDLPPEPPADDPEHAIPKRKENSDDTSMDH